MPKARHTNASSKKSEIVSGRPEVTELTNNVTVDKLRFDVNDQSTGDMSHSGWYHAKFALAPTAVGNRRCDPAEGSRTF